VGNRNVICQRFEMSTLQAQIVCNEDLRGAERYAADDGAEALIPGADSTPCTVLDISATGARIALADEATTVPDSLKIYIADRDLIADCKVVWRKGKEFGVTFESTAIL